MTKYWVVCFVDDFGISRTDDYYIETDTLGYSEYVIVTPTSIKKRNQLVLKNGCILMDTTKDIVINALNRTIETLHLDREIKILKHNF